MSRSFRLHEPSAHHSCDVKRHCVVVLTRVDCLHRNTIDLHESSTLSSERNLLEHAGYGPVLGARCMFYLSTCDTRSGAASLSISFRLPERPPHRCQHVRFFCFPHFVVLPASHAVRDDRFRILVALRIIASQLVLLIALIHAPSSSGDAILIISHLNLG